MNTVKAYLRFAVEIQKRAQSLDRRKLVGFVMENPVSNREWSMFNMLQVTVSYHSYYSHINSHTY